MIQLSHHQVRFENRNFPLVLVLDKIASPANVGSIFRLAEAFGVHKVVLCGATFSDFSSSRLRKTARSTVEKVKFERQENTVLACAELLKKGYQITALEIAADSLSVETANFKHEGGIALVLGNERSGVQEEVLQIVNQKVHISMFGTNSSINVAQAAGIALFEITKSLSSV